MPRSRTVSPTHATERRVDTCRQAPIDTSWAVVTLVAKPGADFSPTSVVLHGGGGSWAIVDSGTGNVACGKVPQQVAVDLGIVCTGRRRRRLTPAVNEPPIDEPRRQSRKSGCSRTILA